MQISLNALITTLFLTSSVLAQGRYHSLSESHDCDIFHAVYSVTHPHMELLSTHHNITFSNTTTEDGQAYCCDLCNHSPHNCMLAQYDEDNSVCQMSIIKKASKQLDPAEPELKAQCPFGVSNHGGIYEGRQGRGVYMTGPCWRPILNME